MVISWKEDMQKKCIKKLLLIELTRGFVALYNSISSNKHTQQRKTENSDESVCGATLPANRRHPDW